MRLNNKGYLIVEIIVASVIAMGLAYFLLELVLDLKNKNEDYYVNTVLETDKALMTREVMNDISNYKIKSVTSNNVDYVEFVFDIEGEEVTKRITINDNIFKYGKYDDKYILDEDYYEKNFANELKVTGLSITNNCYYSTGYAGCKDINDESMKDVTDGLITISIDAKTPYSDYNYGLELNINYKIKSLEFIIKTYDYGVDDKEYNEGTIINWCGKEWYVLKNSPKESSSVTLILKNNYKTGIYGSSITYINSNVYNSFLGEGDTLINEECIKSAKEEGTLLLEENNGEYIRLPESNELSNKIPNGSGTPFWTMTPDNDKLFLGSSTGELAKNYFSDENKGTIDLYANEYEYYYTDSGWANPSSGISECKVVAESGQWWTQVEDASGYSISPQTQNITVYAEGEIKKKTACKTKSEKDIYYCAKPWYGTNASWSYWYFGPWRFSGSTGDVDNYLEPNAESIDICWGTEYFQVSTVRYASNSGQCTYRTYPRNATIEFAVDPIEFYTYETKPASEIGYRPVVTILKKNR